VAAEHLREGQVAFAEHLVTVPGFVSKTWLHDGDTQGGFYLFDDRPAAESYLGGALFAGLRDNPAFTDLTVRGYEVAAELGALTGSAVTTPGSAG
jgi:hypothetical protein